MAGYVNSPPLILTTLAGAEWLSDPARFAGQPGSAFISAIRVRVSDVAEPSVLAQKRLASVAASIVDSTGLQVDVVKGASPRPIDVDLPGGLFGRPPLTVQEGWSKKNVVVAFREAARTQDLAVAAVTLGSTAFLLIEAAAISIELRRREFDVLRAIGWSRKSIARLVEAEVILVGTVAGLLALVSTALIAAAIGWRLEPYAAFIGPSASVMLSVLVGILTGRRASRGTHAPGPASSRAHGHLAETVSAFAVRDMLAAPGSVAVGVLAVWLSSSLFAGLVLVSLAFSGRLDVTVLGLHLAAQIGPVHLILAAIALGFGSAAAGLAIALRYFERLPEFATLRAIGWARSAVARVLLLQGLMILAIASACCLLTTAALAGLFGIAWQVFMVAATGGIGAATIAMLPGVLLPLGEAYRVTAARSLNDR
jgi:ABC-type antimicrobial peptide transport system permease subunit